MKSTIDYRFVPTGSPEYKELQKFAKSFDHEINESSNINTYAHYRDGILFGYSDHVFLPVTYPAFHPEFTRPKDVIQVMSDWRAHIQLGSRIGYIGVPTNEGRPNFSDEIMNKLGLKSCKREIYYLASPTA
jgi:hypothetical protein